MNYLTQTDGQTETDRQTDRQTDKQTDRQTDGRQTDKEIDISTLLVTAGGLKNCYCTCWNFQRCPHLSFHCQRAYASPTFLLSTHTR